MRNPQFTQTVCKESRHRHSPKEYGGAFKYSPQYCNDGGAVPRFLIKIESSARRCGNKTSYLDFYIVLGAIGSESIKCGRHRLIFRWLLRADPPFSFHRFSDPIAQPVNEAGSFEVDPVFPTGG